MISTDELREFLERSLDDLRLSRGERKVLRKLLKEARLSRHDQEVLFHEAILMAARRLADGRDEVVLDWVEEMVNSLRPVRGLVMDGARVAEAHFLPDEAAVARLVELIDHCGRSLDVCVFTITHNDLAWAVRRAHRRGVAVRVVTDDNKAHDLGSDIAALRGEGIAVVTDHSPAHMHHKFAIVDGRLLITGSFNWTRSAAEENQENFLVSDDPVLVGAYQKEFVSLWSRFGGEVLE